MLELASLPTAALQITPAIASPEFAWAGLILLLPVLSAILCLFCGAIGVKSKLPGAITAIALVASFATTLTLFLKLPADAPRTIHMFDWVAFAWTGSSATGAVVWTGFLAPFSLYVDSLTLLWMLFVTGLGSLITIYATEYMEADVVKGYTHYGAAKAGVVALTKGLARENAPQVRVNAVAPGLTNTAFLTGGTGREQIFDGIDADKYGKRVPMKRMAEPQDMTGPILFLLGPAAAFINGEMLIVDGGVYTQ